MNFLDTFCRFDAIPECDQRTDRRHSTTYFTPCRTSREQKRHSDSLLWALMELYIFRQLKN